MSKARDEFMVVYLPKDPQKLARSVEQASVKRLNAAGKAILKRSVKNMALQEVKRGYRCKAMEFALPNGSILSVLAIERKMETFYLQEAIRENFAPSLRGCENVVYNVKSLSRPDQKRCVEALSLLEELQKTSPPTFKKGGQWESLVEKSRFHSSLSSRETGSLRLRSKRLARALFSVVEDNTLPHNKLAAAEFIEKCAKRGRSLPGVKVEVWRKPRLEKMGAGAFLAVAKGASKSESALIKISWKHPGAQKKVALVGKGIAFDTGGYDLKTEGSMAGMHADKTGASVALAAFEAAVKARLKLDLTCWLAVTENNLTRDAYRPGDVVTSAAGLSVHVRNTDAEGRLVLADAMHFAGLEKPDLMIDLATLTGTIPGSVGPGMAGIFCKNRKLLFAAESLSRLCGERAWPFPMEDMSLRATDASDLADVLQDGDGEDMHVFAAHFLSNFVDEKTKWIHIDLAADHCPEGLGIVETPVTGHGVRLVYALLENAKRLC